MKQLMILVSCLFLGLTTSAQTLQFAKALVGQTSTVSTITTDVFGNISLAGTFQNTVDFDPSTGVSNMTSASGTSLYFGKYSASGSLLWVKQIPGLVPYDIVTDNSGNVYLGGSYTGTVDFDPGTGTNSASASASITLPFIAKYDPNGNFVWAKYATTSTNGFLNSFVYRLSIDPVGGRVHAGMHFYNYSNFSAYLNMMPCSNVSIVASGSGGYVYQTGAVTSFDLVSGDCVPPSANSIDFAASSPTNIFFDNAGAKYVFTSDQSTFSLTKTNGASNWTNGGNLSGGSTIQNYAIQTDGNGDVIIAGILYGDATFGTAPNTTHLTTVVTSPSPGTTRGFYLAKYNGTTGTLMWAGVSRQLATFSSVSNVGGIVIDANNEIIINGTYTESIDLDLGPGVTTVTTSGNTDDNIYLARFSSAGSFVSGTSLGNSGNEYASDLTGVSGGYIVGGSFSGTVDFDPGTPVTNLSAASGTNNSFFAKYASCSGAPAQPGTITGSASACAGSSKTYSVTPVSGATSYSWTLPSGWTGTSTTNSITVTAGSTSGTISVTASNTCGSSMAQSIAVTGNSLPTVSISGPGSACSGGSITLTASGASTYLWNTSSANSSISVSPSSTFTYSVTGTDANGCVNSASKTITVNAAPTVAISGTNAICNGASATLNATGAASYVWNTTATTNNISVSPTATTTYSVVGTDANGCTNSATKTVTVNALPTVTISGANAVCNGASATLNATGAASYVWNTAATTSTISVSPTATTTYSVVGTDANGCTNSATKTVTVNALPTVAISGANAICNGASATLNATGAASYVWNTTATTSTISVSPTATTTYSVVGTDANGCTNSATKTVTVNALPTVTISGANTVCEGSSTALTASGASSYVWNTTATTNNISVSPTATTTYSVVGTDANGCTNSATKTVTVNALPTVTISGANTVCEGSSAILNATGAASYVWNTTATTSSISVSPTATTTYSVVGTDANGCTNSAAKTVTVNALPDVNTTVSGLVITAAPAVSYQWITCNAGNNTPIAGATMQTYTVSANGSYAVISTNAEGCSDTSACVSFTSLGLNELSGHLDIQLYPNPTSGKITLQFDFAASVQVKVRDMQGKLLQISEVSNNESVDLHEFTPGMYLLSIETDTIQIQKQVIKY